MPWKEGDKLPYDGWYGGRADMMIKNGTYADFRPALLMQAEEGFYGKTGDLQKRIEDSMKVIEKWDKEWESIPVEERIAHRNKVADDVQPREVIVNTARGPLKVIRSTPSLNNNLYNPAGKGKKKRNPHPLPSGFITRENNPLGATETVAAAAETKEVDLHGPVEAHLEPVRAKPGRKPKESLVPQAA